MASTIFQDYNQNNPIVSAWLNDVNVDTYMPGTGTPRLAVQQAAAWVRFSVAGGVVTIGQSSGVSSVVRISTGLFQINYVLPMASAGNCYSISANIATFPVVGAEAVGYTQIYFENPADSAVIDPGFVCFTAFGAN